MCGSGGGDILSSVTDDLGAIPAAIGAIIQGKPVGQAVENSLVDTAASAFGAEVLPGITGDLGLTPPTTATGEAVPGAAGINAGQSFATAAPSAIAEAPPAVADLGSGAIPDLTSAATDFSTDPFASAGNSISQTFNYGGGVPTVAPPPTPPPTSFLDKLVKQAASPSSVLGAVGLGANALIPSQSDKLAKQLQAQANTANANASALESPLFTGQLPPGAQGAIDQATNAAKKRVIANYAARGMDTNPATNASLAQELNSIDLQSAGQVFQLASQLYGQGIQESQITDQLYQALLANSTAADNRIGTALGNFTSQLAGGGKPNVTVNLG